MDCSLPRCGARLLPAILLAFGIAFVLTVTLEGQTAVQARDFDDPIANAGFEGAERHGVPQGWTAEGSLRGLVTTMDSVGGSHALELHGGPSRQENVYQSVTLPAGEYTLRAFLRVDHGSADLYLQCGKQRASVVADAEPGEWVVTRTPVLRLLADTRCQAGVRTAGAGVSHLLSDNFSLRRTANFIQNGDFSFGLTHWQADSPGAVKLIPAGVRIAGAERATLSQTVTHLSEGSYTLQADVRNSGGQQVARLETRDCGESPRFLNLPVVNGAAVRTVQLRGITVSGLDRCTIALRVRGSESSWVELGNVRLEQGDAYQMIEGGDVSLTNMVEEHGGLYKLDGEAQDPFKIMANSGMNLARLRLFVDPGNPHYSPSKTMQGQYDNLPDMLRLAKRAQAAGMGIEVALHLSDVWADPNCQAVPHAWLGMDEAHLVKAVAEYVTDVVTKLRAQGTPPYAVALGNETDNGMLLSADCKGAWLPVNASAAQADTLARVYTAGYHAVKAASPSTRVMWHLADIGKYEASRKYLDAMFARRVPVDVLDYSAYPFWSHKMVRQFQNFGNYVAARYGKPVFFEETGYPWAAAAGADNMTNGGPEPYPLSPRGQMDFMNDEIAAIESGEDGMLAGFSYWDATWIPARGTFDNVDNYVLFDREGNALPALTTSYKLQGEDGSDTGK